MAFILLWSPGGRPLSVASDVASDQTEDYLQQRKCYSCVDVGEKAEPTFRFRFLLR